jgi:serine/threonine protein kinase
MIGRTILNYRITRLIGEGGMAAVYYAENKLGKPAAIKILKPEFGTNETVRKRFKQDATILAGLEHTHIRKVLDILEKETDGMDAIIMEYLEGSDLHIYLQQRGRLPESEAISYIKQAAVALQYAHQKRIIHRDIKPANLFRLPDGSLKIIDFGIAKTDHQTWTQTGVGIGTPNYMSPEQILSPAEVDHRTDIYSLGITLYHLLSGQKPFQGDTDYATQNRVVTEKLPLLTIGNPAINLILARATAKNKQERWASCQEFINALDLIQNKIANSSGQESAAITIVEEDSPVILAANSAQIVRNIPLHQTPPPPARIEHKKKPNKVDNLEKLENPPRPVKTNFMLWFLFASVGIGIGSFVFITNPSFFSSKQSTISLAGNESDVVHGESYMEDITITGLELNLRSSTNADSKGNILTVVGRGEALQTIERTMDERGIYWYKVRANGVEGWLSSLFVAERSVWQNPKQMYVQQAKVYFYHFSNGAFKKKKSYLIEYDNVTIFQEYQGFVYAKFITASGKEIWDWLPLEALAEMGID